MSKDISAAFLIKLDDFMPFRNFVKADDVDVVTFSLDIKEVSVGIAGPTGGQDDTILREGGLGQLGMIFKFLFFLVSSAIQKVVVGEQ